MEAREEMRVELVDGAVQLLSPGVGLFTSAEPAGRVLTPGQTAGQLIVLGRATALVRAVRKSIEYGNCGPRNR